MNRRQFLTMTVIGLLFASTSLAQTPAELGFRTAQIQPKLISANAGNYKGRNIELWATRNSQDGLQNYYTMVYPIPDPQGKRARVLVMTNPYTVIPFDQGWVATMRVGEKYFDKSFPASCSTGACPIVVMDSAGWADLKTTADVFFLGPGNDIVDVALANNCAVLVSYIGFYNERSLLASAHGVANAIESLWQNSLIDTGRIALLGRSWGATVSLLAMTIPGRPLRIATVVAEAGVSNAADAINYYLTDLKSKQPPAIYRASRDFAFAYYHRFVLTLGPLGSPNWNYFTPSSLTFRWPDKTSLLLISSEDDISVPWQQSQDLADALKGKVLVKFSKYGTGLQPPFGTKTALEGNHGSLPASRKDQILAWLSQELGK